MFDPDAPQTEMETRRHRVDDDLRTLEDCADHIVAAGAKASLMIKLDEIIKKHRLDSFGRAA